MALGACTARFRIPLSGNIALYSIYTMALCVYICLVREINTWVGSGVDTNSFVWPVNSK